MHRIIGNAIDDEFYLLYNKDEEFRSLSYECYSKLIKRCPFLHDQTEMLFLFVKDHQKVQVRDFGVPSISEEFDEWIFGAIKKYDVNIAAFARQLINSFWENEDIWPSTYRCKSKYNFRKYDYVIKGNSNLFNLDSLYRRIPKKPFIRGRKQELEVLMMYYWLNEFEEDDEGYWLEYLEAVMPSLTSKMAKQ